MANEKRMATKEELVELKSEAKKPVYSHLAMGTAEINGKWAVIEVLFNPLTKEARVSDVFPVEEGMGRDEVRRMFKVKVGTSNILYGDQKDQSST